MYELNNMSQRRLLSFDVGIKNLAYCIIDITQDSPIEIVEWNVLNLCSACENLQPTCGEIQKNKQRCGKPAKYMKLSEHTCEKHAKTSKKYAIPQKEHSTSSLKKLKLDELKTLLNTTTMSQEGSYKKEELLNELIRYYREKEWEKIVLPKKQNASKIDLITLGRSLHAQLSNNPIMSTVTHVIIENQISPIANRMKTIQGMIAQHYISLGVTSIEFVSSGNKLKSMVKQSVAPTGYKQNKQDGIFYCKKYLKDKNIHVKWQEMLSNSPKKDDLCDCFLQAVWWKDKDIPLN